MSMKPETPPNDLREQLLRAVQAVPSPPRAAVSRANAIAIAAGAIAALGLFIATGGARWGDRSLAVVAFTVVGWLAVGAALTVRVAYRSRSMLGPASSIIVLSVAAALSALVAAVFVRAFFGETSFSSGLPAKSHVACLVLTFVFALGPTVALFFMRRASDPVHPRLSGAALGAVGGVWAGLLINLHCPASDDVHLLLGHVGPVVVLACAGALLGRAVLGIRSAR